MRPKKHFARPGRVVMLVDNTIDGDSRVQKAAKSMAEAGWEVHLIGRSPTDSWEHYDLGEARAHRVPYKPMGAPKPFKHRLVRLRFPLALPSLPKAKLRQTRIESDRHELAQRRYEATHPTYRKHGSWRPTLPFALRSQVTKLRHQVLKARLKQTERAVTWKRVVHVGPIANAEATFWTALLGHRAWRKLDPTPLRYELSYAKLIDNLRPDLIHAHDFRMIGVAARSVARANAAGRTVRMVYDAHEFVPGISHPGKKWLKATIAYEREYIGFADAVVTVSPPLAAMLRSNHRLHETPTVVLNAPPKAAARQSTRDIADVRSDCGLAGGVPLMVYCGGAAPQRGLHTMVKSLEYLPEAHAAFVVNRLEGPYVDRLREDAAQVGASDRVHFLPYVPYDVLVEYLATADVGVHPLVTGPVNHEVALSTKFFEFMQAGLPIVVSNVKAMSEQVNELGIGEIFQSEDPKDLARAAGTVLADRDFYTRLYRNPERLDTFTWDAQAKQYVTLYERLLATTN